MQGAIRVPTEKAGTGSPGENLKLVPSEKHEGEPLWLPFLVAAERDRSGTGTTCWRLVVHPDFPSRQRHGAEFQGSRPQSEPQSRRSPVRIIHETEKGFLTVRSF
jgi:hypothetical protein